MNVLSDRRSVTLQLNTTRKAGLVILNGLTCLWGSQAVAQDQPGPIWVAPPSQEQPVLAYIPAYGWVRDTPAALAALNQPLTPAPGRNDLVEDCRVLVERSAGEQGAVRVEAVSAGPQRRLRDGYVAPVEFRIVYPRAFESEVRRAMLTCKANRAGNVLDARPK